ncbi:MAG: polysaccharide deacetylase family protein [Elusimicrobiota bacterium]
MWLKVLSFRKICVFLIVFLGVFVSEINSKTKKTVILSFDDGPHVQTTKRILEILNENKVKATFFLVGKMIEKNPLLVKEIYKNGCEIGNHTYSDKRLITLSKTQIEESIDRVNKLLNKTIGKNTSFFRPPGGRINEEVLEVSSKKGYYIVLWSRYVGDTNPGITADEIYKRATSNPKEKELILMHDGPEQTIKALPRIIEFYKSKGYKFTTVSKVTPPIYLNSGSAFKKNIGDWPIALWAKQVKENPAQNPYKPAGIVGIIALFTSIGSTFYFFRLAEERKTQPVISLVFLRIGSKSIDKITKILREKKLRGTFFVSVEDIKNIKKKDINKLRENDVAYFISNGDNLQSDFKTWKEQVDLYKLSVVPLYYSEKGYDNDEVKYFKKYGFFPVEWKISPPDEHIITENTIKYFAGRIKRRRVVPLWGENIDDEKHLRNLVDKLESKNYRLVSLREYLLSKGNRKNKKAIK